MGYDLNSFVEWASCPFLIFSDGQGRLGRGRMPIPLIFIPKFQQRQNKKIEAKKLMNTRLAIVTGAGGAVGGCYLKHFLKQENTK